MLGGNMTKIKLNIIKRDSCFNILETEEKNKEKILRIKVKGDSKIIDSLYDKFLGSLEFIEESSVLNNLGRAKE